MHDSFALGISPQDLFATAAWLDIQDGTTARNPVSELYGPGAEQAGQSYQALQDAKYGPGQTIADEFARNPRGLTAKTVLNGNTVFVNPNLISGNVGMNEALLLHEALHALAHNDSDIQERLGIAVDDKNTRNITTKFLEDCIKGKENK